MPETAKVMPSNMDVELHREDEKIFRKAFRPTMLLLKIAGYCPRVLRLLRPSDERGVKFLSLFYTLTVLLAIAFHIARVAPFLKMEANFILYLRLCVMVWYIRCLALSIYIIRISAHSNEKHSTLFGIINSLDEGTGDNLARRQYKEIKKFQAKSKIIFWSISTMIVLSCIFMCIAIFVNLGSGSIAVTVLQPFNDSFAFKVFYNIHNMFMVTAWLVPALLYCLICNSLVLKLSFLESKVTGLGENIAIRGHIKKIRRMYLNVTSIVGKADEAFGPVALFIYFFDIVLFSITLYASLFIAKSFIEQLNLWYWSFASLLNLLLISVEAARVEEKVNVSLLRKFSSYC